MAFQTHAFNSNVELDEGSYVYQFIAKKLKKSLVSFSAEVEALPFEIKQCHIMRKGESPKVFYKGLGPCLWEQMFEDKPEDTYIFAKGNFDSGEAFSVKVSRIPGSIKQYLTLAEAKSFDKATLMEFFGIADYALTEIWDVEFLRPSDLSQKMLNGAIQAFLLNDENKDKASYEILAYFTQFFADYNFDYIHLGLKPILEKQDDLVNVKWHSFDLGVGRDKEEVFLPTMYSNYLSILNERDYFSITRDRSLLPSEAKRSFGGLSFEAYGEFTEFVDGEFDYLYDSIKKENEKLNMPHEIGHSEFVKIYESKRQVAEKEASKAFGEFSEFDEEEFDTLYERLKKLEYLRGLGQ